MSTAEQYVRTEFPVIDSDPHFNRVVRYMRGSDVAAWGGLTVGAPAVLLAFGNNVFFFYDLITTRCAALFFRKVL